MSDATPLKTPLHEWHKAHGGRLVEFGGWSMPVQYTTIVEEHRAVRDHVGLFDISHMGRLRFEGPGALDWLERVTTNHVARLEPNQIQYSLMVHPDGGVLDDVLVYRVADDFYGMVCNASNRARVLAQLEGHRAGVEATLRDRTTETAMIAVQGPRAVEVLQRVFAVPTGDIPLSAVKYYHVIQGQVLGSSAFASRTGYTGEDGFELVVPAADAERAWTALLEAGAEFGIVPCGLGARDTLRFEAAMPLYGHELSESVNPFAAGLGWAVKLNKGEFVGREALGHLKVHPGRVRIGLAPEGRRIARQGCEVRRDGQSVGTVTSGTFAPTLGRSLAMALVDPTASAEGMLLTVDIRGHEEPARVTPLPFYRRAGAVKASPAAEPHSGGV